MRTLELDKTGIDGDALQHIARMKRISQLRISHNDISDEDLVPLAQLSSLSLLTVFDTKVSAAGINKLQTALSKCEIVGNDWTNKSATVPEPSDAQPAATLKP